MPAPDPSVAGEGFMSLASAGVETSLHSRSLLASHHRILARQVYDSGGIPAYRSNTSSQVSAGGGAGAGLGRAGPLGARHTLTVGAAVHGAGDEAFVVVVRVVPAVRVVVGRQICPEVRVFSHPVTILITTAILAPSPTTKAADQVPHKMDIY